MRGYSVRCWSSNRSAEWREMGMRKLSNSVTFRRRNRLRLRVGLGLLNTAYSGTESRKGVGGGRERKRRKREREFATGRSKRWSGAEAEVGGPVGRQWKFLGDASGSATAPPFALLCLSLAVCSFAPCSLQERDLRTGGTLRGLAWDGRKRLLPCTGGYLGYSAWTATSPHAIFGYFHVSSGLPHIRTVYTNGDVTDGSVLSRWS